jgi:putative membrane protein
MKASMEDFEQSKAGRRHAEVTEERRATEYLANERTFLAWIRTSIAVVSMGFVITRFRQSWSVADVTLRASASSFTMGTALMGLGALLAVLAVWRYHVVNRAIERGQVKADRGLVFFITFLVVFLSVGMIVFMLLAE